MGSKHSKAELRDAAMTASLRACQFFNGAAEEDLAEIARFSRLRNVVKDEYLFHEAEPVAGFYIVKSGGINVHRVAPTGKEQVIHVFRTGESLAEAALASPAGYPAHARAIESSTVIYIPKIEFLGLVKKRPDLVLRMLGAMSQHLRSLVSLLDDLTLKDIETRLAYWLIKRCPQPLSSDSCVVKLPSTKRILSAELSTSAETLSRTLASFQKRSLISTRGNVIGVPNPLALQAMLDLRLENPSRIEG
jgi:CRP/FNR family transcriptional regulator